MATTEGSVGGRARSSSWLKRTLRAGQARTSSSAVLAIATGHGWRMIQVASAAQRRPSWARPTFLRIRSELMRGPSIASAAGRVMRAPSTAKKTTEVPA